jgi:radical SAM protein with 4Fe4S-binding SPASM domain
MFKPFLISWNITKRCNLKCSHCYLDADTLTRSDPNELETGDAKKIIDQIASVNTQTILILTGGEPFLREDLFDLVYHASQRELMVVLGTNGTLIDDNIAKEMDRTGIFGVGISLDSSGPKFHDSFRGFPGAWHKTIKGIEICRKHDLPLQIQATVTKDNYKDMPNIMKMAHELGAKVFNLFFIVCTGRGQDVTDITPSQYEETLRMLVDSQGKYEGMMVRARCAPHFKRVAYQKNPESPVTKVKGYLGGGCLAGSHYCRITPDGKITACPYLPTAVGDTKKESFTDIWKDNETFDRLRKMELHGKCSTCEYELICGGCRARAYADSGDMMGEDPWCEHNPKEGVEKILIPEETKANGPEKPEWTPEAREILKKIPFFLHNLVINGTESYAVEAGITIITPEVMEVVKQKRGRI